MTEKLLQFIWQMRYFNQQQLQTTQGEFIRIIHPGMLNTNQGPDFLEARIMIGKQLWAGSVELHLKTSDWMLHRHQQDSNYKNVILHVVWQDDLEDASWYGLPTLELQSRVSALMTGQYSRMMEEKCFVACENNLKQVPSLVWLMWKQRLLVERLQRKAGQVLQLFKEADNSWEETLWWMMARNFGIRINADVFEAIAKSLPLKILARHKDCLQQVEALLFGQAGLLNSGFKEAYPGMLKREYLFLQKKYGLRPVSMPVLFLRMRPANFPTVRLAQLAMLIHGSSHLFSRIREAGSLEDIKALLHTTANDYWHYHYRFDEPGACKHKTLGREMVCNIITNTILPVLYCYSAYHDEAVVREKVLHWMSLLPAEKNQMEKSRYGFAVQQR